MNPKRGVQIQVVFCEQSKHRDLWRFCFYPSTTIKNHRGGISNVKISYNTFFKIVVYWWRDLIRHNIGTPLKHDKYIFDIPIPLCHHLYLSATLKQSFCSRRKSLRYCLHVSTGPNPCVRFNWSFIFMQSWPFKKNSFNLIS